ncbi:ABC transporter permease [Effusibacillus pohliae]|uniref:ABC transporter permease n=1 Tax=Effusibacillus pohliae TaxID=232270 RepID=UPI00037BD75D|nr:ABC transporter permease [Effusibacillus pohliae]
MVNYTIRRLIQAIPLLFGITVISFGLMHLTPGGPVALLVDPTIKPEDQERMIHALGLDQPLYVQYFRWLGDLLQGNFGFSFVRRVPVSDLVLERLPNTMLLMGVSLLFSLLIAIPAGIVSATRQYSKLDYTITVGSFLGVSTPNFWLGIMLILLFAVHLSWLPAGGVATLNASFSVWDRIQHLILPAFTLGAAEMAAWTRYTRSSMLEVIRQDFIRTARAKGLYEPTVILRHGLRNSLIPVVTIIGLTLPGLFAGAVITESIFSWPGMGRLFIEAVFQRDYPIIMAITTITACLVVFCNLLVDLIYGFLDPRISYK